MAGKRFGTKLVFLANSTHTNIITDPGILIGLRTESGGVDANITMEEVIGDPAAVSPTVVPVLLSDGVTKATFVYKTATGGLIMAGLTTGAAGSPLPVRTFRLKSSATQTSKLTIIPIFMN